jgi:voltage-gated potassium channel Kch
VSIIDIDPDMIKAAQSFGFKIYYGDGTRLDSLHHSGADEAEVILIRVDDCEAANRIAALCLHEFPQSKVLVRSFDRRHSIEPINAGVTYEIRETLESALALGAEGQKLFVGKPVAVIGASPGGFGTVLAQAMWLPVLRTLRTRPWEEGRPLVPRAGSVFDQAGQLQDEGAEAALSDFMAGFAASF